LKFTLYPFAGFSPLLSGQSTKVTKGSSLLTLFSRHGSRTIKWTTASFIVATIKVVRTIYIVASPSVRVKGFQPHAVWEIEDGRVKGAASRGKPAGLHLSQQSVFCGCNRAPPNN
jgi:hypothetical protein